MISVPGRIPIRIFPFFWVLILLIGWLNSASLSGQVITPLLGTMVWAVVIFFSVLIHEYGHALTALLFGQKAEINLVGLGGVTKRDGPKLVRWKEFLIVMNGPLAGILLFFLSYNIMEHQDGSKAVVFYALQVAVQVNLIWTLLNLLPILPLDGGQLMRILLEGAFGLLGLKIAFLSSIVLATVAGIVFFLIHQVFMGALFLMLAFESYRGWEGVRTLTAHDEDSELQELIKTGVEDLKGGRKQEAFDKFSHVRDKVSKGGLYITATQYGARILAERGDYKLAYLWLYPLKNRLSRDYLLLLQHVAYRLQEWEDAVAVGELLCREGPSADSALLNALSYAIMGKAVPAVGWLRSALELGIPDVNQVIAKREFDMIRNSPPFQKLVDGLNLKEG